MNQTQRNALRTTIRLQEKNLDAAELELQQAKDILKAREVKVKIYKETIEQLKQGLPPYEPEEEQKEANPCIACGEELEKPRVTLIQYCKKCSKQFNT